MWYSFQGSTLNVLLRDPLERIFSFFLSLSAIPRELIQHSDSRVHFCRGDGLAAGHAIPEGVDAEFLRKPLLPDTEKRQRLHRESLHVGREVLAPQGQRGAHPASR